MPRAGPGRTFLRMDHGTLALLIPILALAIPVVAVAGNAMVKVARYKALGSGAEGGPAAGGELRQRLEAVEQEMDAMRQELAEAQERLDFTERLLASGTRAEPPRG